MKRTLRPTGFVSAQCPDCGAMSNFEPKSQFAIDGTHTYRGEVWRRISWTLLQCGGCQRGGLAKTHDSGQPEKAVLEEFFPYAIKTVRLPTAVPKDIEAEFREAELCVSVGANRAASALFRSTLEKTRKVNSDGERVNSARSFLLRGGQFGHGLHGLARLAHPL
jgi:hypothetical protein